MSIELGVKRAHTLILLSALPTCRENPNHDIRRLCVWQRHINLSIQHLPYVSDETAEANISRLILPVLHPSAAYRYIREARVAVSERSENYVLAAWDFTKTQLVILDVQGNTDGQTRRY